MKNNDIEKNRKAIRNSTVDFLVFTKDAGEDSIEVRVQDGEVWLTQDGIAQLFDVDRSVVTLCAFSKLTMYIWFHFSYFCFIIHCSRSSFHKVFKRSVSVSEN